jgi:hypothetical protein
MASYGLHGDSKVGTSQHGRLLAHSVSRKAGNSAGPTVRPSLGDSEQALKDALRIFDTVPHLLVFIVGIPMSSNASAVRVAQIQMILGSLVTVGVWHGWYAARRGLGTNLYRLGVREKTIQSIVCHANAFTTTTYYIKSAAVDTGAATNTGSRSEVCFDVHGRRQK